MGRLCTLLGCGAVADSRVGTQECTQIGGNDPSTPFRGICVHCCDASRDASCVRWHECLSHHGVPAAPPAGLSRLVGKIGSERMAPLPGWHLRRGINPHEPPKSPKFASSRPMPRDRHGGFTTDNVPHVTVSPLVDFTWEWLGIVVDVERGGCNPALDGHGKHTPRAPAWCL